MFIMKNVHQKWTQKLVASSVQLCNTKCYCFDCCLFICVVRKEKFGKFSTKEQLGYTASRVDSLLLSQRSSTVMCTCMWHWLKIMTCEKVKLGVFGSVIYKGCWFCTCFENSNEVTGWNAKIFKLQNLVITAKKFVLMNKYFIVERIWWECHQWRTVTTCEILSFG